MRLWYWLRLILIRLSDLLLWSCRLISLLILRLCLCLLRSVVRLWWVLILRRVLRGLLILTGAWWLWLAEILNRLPPRVL